MVKWEIKLCKIFIVLYSKEVVVISDVHLGTYGCHADELLSYLQSVSPRILVLNGDIIDIWALSKSYFPESHHAVIRHILSMLETGTRIYYLTGIMMNFSGVFPEPSLAN